MLRNLRIKDERTFCSFFFISSRMEIGEGTVQKDVSNVLSENLTNLRYLLGKFYETRFNPKNVFYEQLQNIKFSIKSKVFSTHFIANSLRLMTSGIKFYKKCCACLFFCLSVIFLRLILWNFVEFFLQIL